MPVSCPAAAAGVSQLSVSSFSQCLSLEVLEMNILRTRVLHVDRDRPCVQVHCHPTWSRPSMRFVQAEGI